ncbi:retinol dehydrogenase 12 [Bombardia bombarda]|uniref:Retinol dehydrogenase 12 n=1 Tax=Bombardia bombarda TaxID=252184 RepID=A0AA40C1X8_9PEZI|nr:retinol dehydrogenase 12 [Bombardia bombarda]
MSQSSKLGSAAASESNFRGLVARQLTKPVRLPPSPTQLANQVAVVTGSNVGLGLVASRQLLDLGLSHLVMAVRSQPKGDAAAAQLRSEFPAAAISVWIVDMESYVSVQAFAAKCDAELPRIDFVILNAGLMCWAYTTNPTTKWETTLQVNYLSTALLTVLLVPILKARHQSDKTHSTKPPVISVVGSDVQYMQDVNKFADPTSDKPILQRFNDSNKFSGMDWYGLTKVALTFFVARLAEVVNAEDVTINMSNPGMTSGTAFFSKSNFFVRQLVGAAGLLLSRTVEVGASTYVDATVVKGSESHGSFVSDWTIKPYPKHWYTPEGKKDFGEKLWQETIDELAAISPEAAKIVDELRKGGRT